MDQAALLDALARAIGTPNAPASDYRIAKELGCTRQYVSMVRSGQRSLGDDHAARLAQLARLNPAYVAAILAGARAKRTDSRQAFMKAAAKLATAAAVLLAAVHFALTGETESALNLIAFMPMGFDTGYTLYALTALILAALAIPSMLRKQHLGSPHATA